LIARKALRLLLAILLIDDVNRADDRILRGIMQLLQRHALVSWKLPSRWHIVMTANPDDGNYSVTAMDDAMLTRALHFTMTFDVRDWTEWATAAGVDPRGIDFVLRLPETVSGRLTTPRTLTQFFSKIALIEDLRAALPRVSALAMACLDEETVHAFVASVRHGLTELPSVDAVCRARTSPRRSRRRSRRSSYRTVRSASTRSRRCSRASSPS
jgi:MoxR-like ATPase